MSASPEHFLREARAARARVLRDSVSIIDPRDEMLAPPDAERRYAEEKREQRFWQWFAVVVLLACWVGEATMCAARGF